MKCTTCSEPVRPVVAVDIDGTLGDYHGHFVDFAAGYTDEDFRMARHWAEYDGSVPFNEWLGMTKEEYRLIKLAYRQGAQKRTMPLHEDAKNLVDMLVREGVEIWITTTRPYLRLDNIDPDTREWMRRHRLAYDFLLYDEFKYKQLHERVGSDRVAAVLEDDPEQVDMAADLFPGRVLQVWGQHNSSPVARRNPGVSNLQAARARVRDYIVDWKERHT